MAPDPNATYSGPPVREMLATHTLAREIINRHDDPCPILDGSELELLKDYVMDTSPVHAQNLLQQRQMTDDKGGQLGGGAMDKQSLVGYLIARNLDFEKRGEAAAQGPGSGRGLLDEEIALLKNWFQKGAAEERIMACKEGQHT